MQVLNADYFECCLLVEVVLLGVLTDRFEGVEGEDKLNALVIYDVASHPVCIAVTGEKHDMAGRRNGLQIIYDAILYLLLLADLLQDFVCLFLADLGLHFLFGGVAAKLHGGHQLRVRHN